MMDNFFSGETLYYGYDIKDYQGAVVDIRADAVTLKLARWQGGYCRDNYCVPYF